MLKINATELRVMLDKLSDPKRFAKASENALFNASEMIASKAKVEHIFDSKSRKLEDAIFTEVEGLKSSIFVPVEGNLGVSYAPWIWYGKRTTSTGKTATWNGGRGDPFIETAYIKYQNQFINEIESELTEEIEDYI